MRRSREKPISQRTMRIVAVSGNCSGLTRCPSVARLFPFHLKQPFTLPGHGVPAWVNVNLFEMPLASVMEPRMPVHEIVEYETWNLNKTEMPPRSRLYHLRPAGFGTGSVESLTS